LLDLGFGLFFETDERISGGGSHTDQLVELQLQGLHVPVLGVLDHEDHQKGHDRRTRVMTSCQVSDQPKSGPVAAHKTMLRKASEKATVRPSWRSIERANLTKTGGCSVALIRALAWAESVNLAPWYRLYASH
jgi:hypothetical protein